MNFFLISIACFFIFSCQRAEKESMSRVTFRIPARALSNVSAQKLNPNGTINPTSLADINCYGVLVSGPEDFLRRNQCQMVVNSTKIDVGFFVGGFFASSAAANTQISFDVISGKDRVFRLVGFQVDTANLPVNVTADKVCSSFRTTEFYENYLSDPFILGEVGQVELAPGAVKDVDLAATFNSQQKVGDCTGPDFSKSKSAGAASQFGIVLQDRAGLSGNPLNPNSCVGVKFKLLDSNGNNADLSANPLISARIKVEDAGLPRGSFYNTSLESFCDSTDLITPTSGDITISFYSAGQAFNDRVLFFKPNASSTIRTLEISDVNQVLTSTTQTFNYTATVASAAGYGFYDLFNNKSSALASTAANRGFIKRNECRPGAVQFIDSNGVATTVVTPMTTPKQIQVGSTAVSSGLSFFSTLANCQNNGSPSDQFIIAPTSNNQVRSYNFYYKINQASLGQFSFSITNTTGAQPVVSGDLTTANNFWNAYD